MHILLYRLNTTKFLLLTASTTLILTSNFHSFPSIPLLRSVCMCVCVAFAMRDETLNRHFFSFQHGAGYALNVNVPHIMNGNLVHFLHPAPYFFFFFSLSPFLVKYEDYSRIPCKLFIGTDNKKGVTKKKEKTEEGKKIIIR